MGNVESASKKFENFSIFWMKSDQKFGQFGQKLDESFWQKTLQHAVQMNGVPSFTVKNMSISNLTVKTGLKNIPFAL